MARLRDFARSGHPPTLVCAFLHFDISFMVWVILGALMPFIAADGSLTGRNLRITPTAEVRRAGEYTLVIRGPQTVRDNPALAADQPRNVYNLLIKPGNPGHATRASVRPTEQYVLSNGDPASIAAVNARSRVVRLEVAPEAKGNPNETVAALLPAAALAPGAGFQEIANGYPAGVKLTLIAIPLLAAAFWRILLGVLADRFGSRRVGIASMALTLVPLLIGWKWGGTYESLALAGCFLGLAGASFAVALPLASRWYPPELQGLAMGIAGAGNSGTILATLFAPMLAKAYGWHAVFGLVLFALAERLDPEQPFPAEPRAVFEELRRASAGGAADYSGITYDRIAAEDGVFWPCPGEGHPGTPRLFLDRFATPDGRARFHPVVHRPAAEEPDGEYPFYLTTGRVMAQYQSGTQTRRVAALREAAPRAFVEIHPALAGRYGIAEGDPVRVETRRGAAVAAARLTGGIRQDTLFLPFHWGGQGRANLLTNPALDPVSRMPEFKVCAARIERIP